MAVDVLVAFFLCQVQGGSRTLKEGLTELQYPSRESASETSSSRPAVSVAHFGGNVPDRLSSSREELPVGMLVLRLYLF